MTDNYNDTHENNTHHISDTYSIPAEDISLDDPLTMAEIIDEKPERINFFSRIKHNLTADPDKPLSPKDQFIVMCVILFISLAVFSIVYFTALILSSNNQNSENLPAVTDVSQVTVTSADTDTASAPKQIITPFGTVKLKSIDREQIHFGSLILVDKECRCRYEGENTAPIIDSGNVKYDLADYSVSLDKDIIGSLNDMLNDFHEIYGRTSVMVACGYRSFETQAELYNNEIMSNGEENADKSVAPPGFSEHQTGFAFDLNLNIDTGTGGIIYEGDDIYSWINENCQNYGFIIRYPVGKEDITGYIYEPWHFRYVGEASASYIAQNELTLEEYLDIVHTATAEKPLTVESSGKKWYIYYVKAEDEGNTEVPVPKNLKYEISGDNYSGFIVTVSA